MLKGSLRIVKGSYVRFDRIEIIHHKWVKAKGFYLLLYSIAHRPLLLSTFDPFIMRS